MKTSRREFVSGAVALGAFGAVRASVLRPDTFAASQGVRLRIGILSDTHLDKDSTAARKFKRALEAFRKRRVDGVLICGDLTDNGIIPQMEEVARTWESVFPDSKGLDGTHVERLFLCGDHDNRGNWMSGEDKRVCGQYGWTKATLDENTCFLRIKETWERIFGETWSQIVHKRVKGYDFVLAHFNPSGRNTTPGLKQFLEGVSIDPAKPFFYAQHRVLRNTVCGSGAWGQDDGSVGKLLSAYPNCCAFCGHSHQSAVREDAIWQGAFTAVQVPSLKYLIQEAGHENKPDERCAEQGMLLDVYDERMAIHRIDFANGKPLGPSWEMPLGANARPFAHETRRRSAPVPEFPAGARLIAEIKQGGGAVDRLLSLEFPVVNGLQSGVRAYDYEVTLDAILFGGDVQRSVRRVFAPDCHFAPLADGETMKVELSLREFRKSRALKSPKTGALHVSVRPREVFGGIGRAIETDAIYSKA